jgi:two-component system cell cycle sensor histidine kinase PleC
MAWTWSAPQRGTVASAVLLPVCQRAIHSAIIAMGRGDATRGLCISFAAFLTIAGAAAPNLSPLSMAALLFLTGAALMLYVTTMTGASMPGATDVPQIEAPKVARPSSTACLRELLTPQKAASACDRAAFACLTSHMSHELRTPLNAIIGFSELMSNEVFGPLGSSSYAAYARDIHASGLSLLKSAEDALAITSLLTATEQQHRAAIAHAAIAGTDALAFHATSLASRGIAACCTIDSETEILCDAQAARQLLINLIADATHGAEAGAQLSLASRTNNGWIEVLITVAGQRTPPANFGDSFSMLLARTLSELTSAQIIEDDQVALFGGAWSVAVRFQRAAQNDFFSTIRSAA